mmetsp:Transcript_11371/g.37243  ORF Transcript_11371/g.37243 Transcript_11371/m.37243 type:complete len:231 (+) Transcript_11371:439-1131(+)
MGSLARGGGGGGVRGDMRLHVVSNPRQLALRTIPPCLHSQGFERMHCGKRARRVAGGWRDLTRAKLRGRQPRGWRCERPRGRLRRRRAAPRGIAADAGSSLAQRRERDERQPFSCWFRETGSMPQIRLTSQQTRAAPGAERRRQREGVAPPDGCDELAGRREAARLGQLLLLLVQHLSHQADLARRRQRPRLSADAPLRRRQLRVQLRCALLLPRGRRRKLFAQLSAAHL